MIISGFWQNFDYWDDNFNYELRVEGIQFRKLLNEINNLNPIIFHYRLGKINNRWEHGWGALSPKFLSNALKILNPGGAIPMTVWVFSNDLPEAKKLINPSNYSPYTVIYIDDLKLSPSELLLLFSKVKTLICSNSTFSILAAKIGNVENVVVPSDLSKNGHKNIDLPNHWTRVNSVWLN
jgi:hypothetical protein